jgi:hypothetical protein
MISLKTKLFNKNYFSYTLLPSTPLPRPPPPPLLQKRNLLSLLLLIPAARTTAMSIMQ